MVRSSVSNLWKYAIFVDTYARLQLKSEASRYYLGYLWWVLEPILYVSIFYFVFQVALGKGGDSFLLFLFCGKILFLWFSKTVSSGSKSIIGNRALTSKISIPKVIFPYITIQNCNYKQIFPTLLLISLAIIFGYYPTMLWFLIIPIIVTMLALIGSFTLLSALLTSLVADIGRLIPVLMIFLMLVSGIFWDIQAISDPNIRDFIFYGNPLLFLIDATRKIIMYKESYDFVHMMLILSISLLATLIIHKSTIRLNAYITAKENQ